MREGQYPPIHKTSWFCTECIVRAVHSLENHIKKYARTRVCGLGKGLTIQPFI